MGSSQTIIARFCAILFATFIFVSPTNVVDAKAKLVAVILLRSTAASKPAALSATRAIAARIAEQDGWDARVIQTHGSQPADAAAGIGAEVYVIGQYFGGSAPHITGAAVSVATDQQLTTFNFYLTSGRIPQSVSFSELVGGATSPKSASALISKTLSISIPSGELISVVILKDIGSRISQEGDVFPVLTAEDYYYKGSLILPKGSPGYGVITHIKRAGNFHAGGEIGFTVKRLVTPSKTDLLVETDGATADASKETEKNGNAFGQYLLWGVGAFAQRGNDILIKKGTTFHVSTIDNSLVPVASLNAEPAGLDPAMQIDATGQYIPPNNSTQSSQDVAVETPAPQAVSTPVADNVVLKETPTSRELSVFQPPPSWLRQARNYGSDGMTTLGYWTPNSSSPPGEWISLSTQPVPNGLAPAEFASITRQNLQQAIGAENLRSFRATRICNGLQDGWYAESNAYVGTGRIIAEQTIGIIGNDSYVATYGRPDGTPEDVSARLALDSLCPVQRSKS